MEGTRVGLLLYRTEQDAFSAASHKKAAAATQAGRFKDEIVPIDTHIMDPKTKEKKAITVAADDGIRASTTSEGLSKLKPSFKEGGSTTAGNSSQVLYSYAGWLGGLRACMRACMLVCVGSGLVVKTFTK
jgi:acetyl-CoA acetyltransferase